MTQKDTNSGSSSAPQESEIDADKLNEKYREERDKRIRDDGNEQYLQFEDQFAQYMDDPYVEPGFKRAPLSDEVDVVIIGGGFGGLLAAARLREAGVKDIRVIEKGGDFGGTWYWNRYPGIACDIESYIYLPLLEEVGYMPVEKYSKGDEIFAHSQAIGKKYDLYKDACFQTEVTELNWDEDFARWTVETNHGDKMRARFVCMSNGPLNKPKLPGIPGIQEYKGHAFHTSRWDYDYTGGDMYGKLDGLKDKVVGIIGTGATAVQCVPHLGEGAKELFVFQRTPSSVDFRNNKPTDTQWAETLEPGWHQHRMNNFNSLLSGGFESEDLVDDGWTDIVGNMMELLKKKTDGAMDIDALFGMMEKADHLKMEEIRGRVEGEVANQDDAAVLKPYYRQFCKRPCFHDDYLATYNKPSVHIVDTDGKGVERITEKGVVVAGVEYPVDCLIYSTGFEVGTAYTRRAGYEIYGRGGISLGEKWDGGIATLHGLHSRGFPNLFIMGTAQTAFTANYPHALSEQGINIAYTVKHAIDNDIRTLEASEAAEAKWVETIISKARMGTRFFEACTPGYYNNEGKPGERSGQDGFYGGSSDEFFRLMKSWREEGSLEGLELEAAQS